jgi:hypothetical protein
VRAGELETTPNWESSEEGMIICSSRGNKTRVPAEAEARNCQEDQFAPLLMCLTSALLLEASVARDLPALGTAGTALFLASLVATTASLFLLLLHAGRH